MASSRKGFALFGGLLHRCLRWRLSSRIKLEAVLVAMRDAVAIFDLRGDLIDFNEAFSRIHRFKSREDCFRALGDYAPTFKVYKPDGASIAADEWPVTRALSGVSEADIELLVERIDTGERWTGLYSSAPILTNGGLIAAAVVTVRDVTEAKRTEQRLVELSSRLNLALSAGHLGVWDWDIKNNRLTWDDRMFEIYGIPRDESDRPVDFWKSHIHPDDQELAMASTYAALRGEGNFDVVFRVVRPDGRTVYLKGDGVVLRDREGKPERMLGVNVDITEERIHQQELRKAYAEVEARVTERTAQLEAAKVAAENASKAKDLFLATLSHELRSPLSAILSWAQLMERGVLSPEKMRVALRTIKESAWAQNQLIGDLLDLSRIATGKLHVDLQPLNITDVVKAAIEGVRPLAEQHGLTIEEHVPTDELYISADPARLKQSFWNVLSNAVKFTPAGGKIVVTVSQQAGINGDCASVSIRDTGKGIKPEFLPNIFERFSQADPSSVRIHGGMGLGLSLVNSLVKLQGGTVTAESPGEGLGATFNLCFPLLATSAEPAGRLPEVSKAGEDLLVDGSLKDLKVLLVEDGEKTRLALEQLLVAQGATVQAKASVKDALSTFESFHPDVIVSDIAMPQEDGHSFIRKIRALGHQAGGDTPALALTAYADPRDREQAFASGFQEYLNKPVDVGILAHAILKLTGRPMG